MTTLRIGIADYGAMKERTMRIARGEGRPGPDEPKVWFASTEAFARALSAGNLELLRTITERAPASLDELAGMTGRAKSNLSRALKGLVECGLVEMQPDGRRRRPKVLYDRVSLEVPLTGRRPPRGPAGGGP